MTSSTSGWLWIYIFPIGNHLLIIADAGDALTSHESESTSEQESWNSKRKGRLSTSLCGVDKKAFSVFDRNSTSAKNFTKYI